MSHWPKLLLAIMTVCLLGACSRRPEACFQPQDLSGLNDNAREALASSKEITRGFCYGVAHQCGYQIVSGPYKDSSGKSGTGWIVTTSFRQLDSSQRCTGAPTPERIDIYDETGRFVEAGVP